MLRMPPTSMHHVIEKPLASTSHASGITPTSRHDVREKPPTSISHARGITPSSRPHDGKNRLTIGHHVKTHILCENPLLKWRNAFSLKECYT